MSATTKETGTGASAVLATTSHNDNNNNNNKIENIIRVLPSSVVDQIAAGEVVQRAASAIKELCENSLDANATSIQITIASNITSFTVSDNGCGISRHDLPLACTRHATSKLSTVDDLQSMTSYGFRGEALASISRVARVTITSKIPNERVAYQMSYIDGAPVSSNVLQPKPTARTVGTTIAVSDLFYNLPSRQRLRPSDEYQAILSVLQRYALHCAATSGVAISCQKQQPPPKSTVTTDLHTSPFVTPIQQELKAQHQNDSTTTDNTNCTKNTQQQQQQQQLCSLKENAAKQVISHIYGSHLAPHLLPFESSLYANSSEILSNNDDSTSAQHDSDEKKMDTDDSVTAHSNEFLVSSTSTSSTTSLSTSEGGNVVVQPSPSQPQQQTQQQQLIYSCSGFVTLPSSGSSTLQNNKKSRPSNKAMFILFINQHLVDGCAALQRMIQDVYVEFGSANKGSGTTTTTPPWMYLSITVPPDTVDVNVHPTKRDVTLLHLEQIGTHIAQHLRQLLSSTAQSFVAVSPHAHIITESKMISSNPYKSSRNDSNDNNNNNNKRQKTGVSSGDDDTTVAIPASQPVKQPKNMIRTNRSMPTGSLEPFLINKTTKQLLSQSIKTSSSVKKDDSNQSMNDAIVEQHLPDCPLRATDKDTPSKDNDIDLSLPGAFATAAARCNCPNAGANRTTTVVASAGAVAASNRQLVQQQQGRIRFQRVVPTPCPYTSIQQLRELVQTQRSADLEDLLRNAYFVGVVSHDRSLIQCGEQLVLLNHFACTQQLFYQLALFRFGGGCGVATLPGDESCGVDVVSAIGQFVQFEELLQETSETDLDSLVSSLPLKMNETNQTLAEQTAACLLENAEMLLEYYSIRIEKDPAGRIRLLGLPVLLEGYEPSSHGLPLFLLRLATEVNWADEKQCFQGICRELGCYYSHLPLPTGPSSSMTDAACVSRIRHLIFPAVSTLLVPGEQMKNTDFVTLTSLPKLYRVFERC